MTFQPVHWTILLCLPTEVPALFKVFAQLDEAQLREAVAHDLAVCRRTGGEDAEFVIEHLTLFANEELENRGLLPL